VRFRNTAICALLAAVVLVWQGCGGGQIVELKKEGLFAVPIGSGDEEIGIIREESGRFIGPSRMLFKNGFFFMVDDVNRKIMKITTPGDVILVISKGNEEGAGDVNTLKTKQRRYYDFNLIGDIAVDGENNIYVEDKRLYKEEKESFIDILSFDEEIKEETEYEEIYKSYILKFDRIGSFIHKIGIGGVDSEPFYYIYRIDVDKNGNLIVITAEDDWQSWNSYKYSENGELISKCTVTREDIVEEEEEEERAVFVMDTMPTGNEDELVYWVSYYETTYDTKRMKKEEDLWGEEIEIEDYNSSGGGSSKQEKRTMRDLLGYRLVYYDLQRETVSRTFKWGTPLGGAVESTEEFLGMDGASNGFLWKYLDENKAIVTIFKQDGNVIAKRSFAFENDGIWMNVHVSEDGSVSAIKIDDTYVHFYRWRSDRLISSKDEKVTLKGFISEKVEGFKNANR